MVFAKFAPILAVAVAVSSVAAMPTIHPSVHRTLRQQGTVNLMVTMKEAPENVMSTVKEAAFTSRGAKIEAMVDTLSAHAEKTQAELSALFNQESASTTPLYTSTKTFWVSNQRYIENASVELVEKLASLSSIAEVREEQVLPAPVVNRAAGNETVGLLANQWGVAKVNAPAVWAAGNTGEGIVVSSIDSGVRYTHQALKGNYRGDYGWFDPEKKSAAPYDDEEGHGSHTMGTIAGANGLGVAPGATWMSCRGCRLDGCYESDLTECAQFITCPTDTSGKNKDCSKAPHLVSNSWGGGQGDTFYKASIDAWRAADIVPIFANGNEGRGGCKTASSPGDSADVIGVGATDSSDKLADFSSKGPTVTGIIKPDISGPGVNVVSVGVTSDTSTATMSGTSMATPHVAGVIALYLAAHPSASYDDVYSAITSTVETSIPSSGYTCGSTKDTTYPNNQYGYGRINAEAAVGGGSSTPAPTTKTPAPTTKTPAPTTKTPAPTTKTPAPTTKTPAPTTKAPSPGTCSNLSFYDCYFSLDCYWSWSAGECKDY